MDGFDVLHCFVFMRLFLLWYVAVSSSSHLQNKNQLAISLVCVSVRAVLSLDIHGRIDVCLCALETLFNSLCMHFNVENWWHSEMKLMMYVLVFCWLEFRTHGTGESETIQCVEVRRLYRFYDVLNGFCWEIFYSHIRIGCADWVWWLWLNKSAVCA